MMDPKQLAPPEHVVTPTGAWNFFKELDLEATDAENELAATYDAPDGVLITPFAALSDEQRRLVDEHLGTLLPARDTHLAHHALQRTGGLLVQVTKPVQEPVLIAHALAKQAFRNTLLLVSDGAEATVIETFAGESGLASHVCEAFLGENSHVTYANAQSVTGTFLARKSARTGRDASIDWFELNANNGKTFSRVTTRLDGVDSSTKNLSVYLGKDEELVDFGARALHEGRSTSSNLLTKGVLGGKARAIYEGVLRIGDDAAGSGAFQEENCLLASPDAEVKASPMLYINNNDVKCSHAATAGRMDEEQLFYLRARGLPTEAAQRLVVKAFVWPVVEALGERARSAVIPVVEPLIERYAEGN